MKTGWINVDEMLSNMSSRQWAEWQAFDKLEPLNVGDQMQAEQTAMFQQVHKDSKSPAMDRGYYLSGMTKAPVKPKQSPEQQQANFLQQFAGRINRA